MRTLTLTVLLVACVSPGRLQAEVVRYRYVADACGNLQIAPGACGTPGERSPWAGGPVSAYPKVPVATHVMTFRHSYTGQNVNVPITFPDSATRVETLADYVQFNFTAYQIRVRFLPDGSVEVVYNSGWLRPIAFQ